jgi:hypothetical protein
VYQEGHLRVADDILILCEMSIILNGNCAIEDGENESGGYIHMNQIFLYSESPDWFVFFCDENHVRQDCICVIFCITGNRIVSMHNILT